MNTFVSGLLGASMATLAVSGLAFAVGAGGSLSERNAGQLVILFGRIGMDGNIISGRGITSVETEPDRQGRYLIGFDRDVSKCAFSGAVLSGAVYGYLIFNPVGRKRVEVFTKREAPAGTLADFTLTVVCRA